MRYKRLLFGFVFFCFLASFASAAVIVVNDSQILFLNASEEKSYTLEDIVVSGDLKTNSLDVSGEGEILSGRDVRVYLFGRPSDVLVKDVLVNGKKATVSFDEDGYYVIVPEGEFTFSSKLLIRTLGQTSLFVRGPVNQLRFQLKNGYAIDGDKYGLINGTVLLQRAEKAAMIADGSFRFTYAERDEFLYQMNFKSFGSSLGGYTLDLLNGEQVSQVTGAVKWEQKGDTLVLDLGGDTASLVISGLFSSQNLRVPLPSDRHHVVVESDPEKKIAVTTSATEVDVSESPVRPQYSNARAFLAQRNDAITVTVKKLDLLPSLAAAVNYATNTVAVTEKGSVLGELTYSYANTGVDYVEVDTPGDPLYASTDREPVKLTSEGKLLLALPKTQYGSLDLVYFTTRGKIKPVDLISIPIAKTDLPVSQATTNIYLPKEYFILKTFGAPGGSELPRGDIAVLYVVLMGILGGLIVRDRRFIAYYIVASIGILAFGGMLLLALIAVSLGVIAKRILSGKRFGLFLGGIVAVIAVGIIAAILFAVIWQLGVFNMGGMSSVSRTELGADNFVMEKAAAPSFKGLQTIGGEGAGAITVPTRKGVYPVKLEMPSLGKTISVKNYLVTKEHPIELKVLVLASYFKYLLYLLSAFACVRCLKIYGEKKEPS